MVKPQKVGKNIRMSFSKIDEPLEMPSLIEIQKESFNWFLEKGLMEVLEDVSPITDYSGNLFMISSVILSTRSLNTLSRNARRETLTTQLPSK